MNRNATGRGERAPEGVAFLTAKIKAVQASKKAKREAGPNAMSAMKDLREKMGVKVGLKMMA